MNTGQSCVVQELNKFVKGDGQCECENNERDDTCKRTELETRQTMYVNLTLSGVRATIVAVE